MKYLLLIYANEAEQGAMPPDFFEKLIGEYMAFGEELKAKGAYIAGDALKPTQTATTVRVRGGKTVKTDGPFAETKEQLGGYYVIEAKDLDEALGWAAKVPDSKYGSIEVRPVMVFDNM